MSDKDKDLQDAIAADEAGGSERKPADGEDGGAVDTDGAQRDPVTGTGDHRTGTSDAAENAKNEPAG